MALFGRIGRGDSSPRAETSVSAPIENVGASRIKNAANAVLSQLDNLEAAVLALDEEIRGLHGEPDRETKMALFRLNDMFALTSPADVQTALTEHDDLQSQMIEAQRVAVEETLMWALKGIRS